jgi:Uma2 family endonuclease
MSIAIDKPMTLEEYLDYDDGTDARYELVDGALVNMGAESPLNINIAIFLIVCFAQFLPVNQIHRGTEIEVAGNKANTRYPDLMVLSAEGVAVLAGKKRSLITQNMPAPALVIEVVSSSDTDRASRERDYGDKRREYSQRGIPEYWIIDPLASVVLVLRLVEGRDEERKFEGGDGVMSSIFPQLGLSAAQILTAN